MTKLKEIRTEKKLSQGDIARATGVTVSSISAWENKTRDFDKAQLRTAIKIADALGITDLRELCDGYGTEPEDAAAASPFDIDLFYPVGAVFQSLDATLKPGKMFGGKWEQQCPGVWVRVE